MCQGPLDNESREGILLGEIKAIAHQAGQICREKTGGDHGIDMEIEWKDDQGQATARLIYLQLKSGDSHLRRRADGAEIFRIPKPRHVSYWMSPKEPVFLVIRDSAGTIRWMEIREYLRRESENGRKPVTQIVFQGEPFDVPSLRRWRDRLLAAAPAAPQQALTQLLALAPERFFGRQEHLARLVERLRAGKRTAVVGPPGMGKTALAAEAVRLVVGDRGSELAASPYPDGVFFLDLYVRQGQAEPAWHDLASAVAGLDFRTNSPARERAAEACRGRRLLVVVEGGEEATGQDGRTSMQELLGVLSGDSCWLFLTRESREVRADRTVFLREPLNAEDAAGLLAAPGAAIPGDLRQRVLALFDGHPLALTWAGNLLASGEEPAELLVKDWETDPQRTLVDPEKPHHRLAWLFERSTRNLDEPARRALEAAGLLAHAPFYLELIAAALPEGSARDALKKLVQRGLLRVLEGERRWLFSHVLVYAFARREKGSDPQLLGDLTSFLKRQLEDALKSEGNLEKMTSLLDHMAALLRADEKDELWKILAEDLLYDVHACLLARGRLPLVESALAAVRTWLERKARTKAEEDPWQRELGALLFREGGVQMAQGDLDGALSTYRRLLGIARQLAAKDPANALWHRDLSVGYEKIGLVLQAQGNLDCALSAFRRSFELAQRLASGNPSNIEWQQDLSLSIIRIGRAFHDQGDLANALFAFRRSLEIAERLAAMDPSDTQRQRELSVGFNLVGTVLQDQGDLEGALSAFGRDLEVAERLAASDPSNPQWQRDLSLSHSKVGGVLQAQGDLEGAFSAFQRSLGIAEQLVAKDPSNTESQCDLSISHNKVGGVLQAQGNLDGALSAFRRSLEIAEQLATQDPSNPKRQRDLSIRHDKVGSVFQDQGAVDGALSAYRRSLEIREKLADKDPSNAQWQRDLFVSLYWLAKMESRRGDGAEALRLAKASLAIAEKLVALDPTNAVWQDDLRASREQVDRFRSS